MACRVAKMKITLENIHRELAVATASYRVRLEELGNCASLLSRARQAFNTNEPQGRALIETAEQRYKAAIKAATQAEQRYKSLCDIQR